MIRTLVALDGGLARGAVAFVLSRDDDIEVVGEVADADDVRSVVTATRPNVMVVDLELVGFTGLPGVCAIREDVPGCAVLILAEAHRSPALLSLIMSRPHGIGFLAKEIDFDQLVAAVHQVGSGEAVFDSRVVASALRARNPLTPREAHVLATAADGLRVKDLAARLGLAPGTVRNHLSRVATKVGARTRIDAVRIAQASGWI